MDSLLGVPAVLGPCPLPLYNFNSSSRNDGKASDNHSEPVVK